MGRRVDQQCLNFHLRAAIWNQAGGTISEFVGLRFLGQAEVIPRALQLAENKYFTNFTFRPLQQPVVFYGGFFVKSGEKWRSVDGWNNREEMTSAMSVCAEKEIRQPLPGHVIVPQWKRLSD